MELQQKYRKHTGPFWVRLPTRAIVCGTAYSGDKMLLKSYGLNESCLDTDSLSLWQLHVFILI